MKDIKKLMKRNNFEVVRQGKHIIWEHKFTNKKVTTSATPSRGNAINCIRQDIKSVLRGSEYKLAA